MERTIIMESRAAVDEDFTYNDIEEYLFSRPKSW